MDDPFRGAQGAVRERVAVVGAVRDLDAFSGSGIEHGMVAHDVSGPHGLYADFVLCAFPDEAVTSIDACFPQVPVFGRGQDFGEFQRGAARRVFLLVVMSIDDFQVIAIAECLGHLSDHLEQYRNPHAHVGRLNAGDRLRVSAELVHFIGRQPRGADDHGSFVLDGLFDVVQRGGRCGEIDDHVAQGQGQREIVRQRNAERPAAGHLPGVFAQGRVSWRFRGAGQSQAG